MDRKLLAVDAACLLVYLVAASPALTGIGIHEWLGLGVLVVFFAHAAMHVDWAVEAVRSAFARPSWARTGNLALDLLIVAAFMTVTVSGIMVSGAVLPALGLYADGYYFWDPLHAIAAKALLALLLVHVVAHWRWLAEAAAGGEWDEAAGEILAALGLPAEVPAAAGDPAGPPAARAADTAGPAGADALLRALRPEATRLFVGAPEPACSPYEGVWAAESDGVQPLLFVNPRSMEVERFMRSCGLGRPEGTNEPLDHVATECELLERLALRAAGAPASEGAPDGAGLPGGSPAAAYETFLSGHAQAWMPAFAERLAAEARHPFYRAAAAYLGALLADWPSEA